MENLLVEKMDQREPRSRRPRTLINHKPFDIFDVRSKFVSSVNISAKKIHDLLKLDENQRLSGQFDILDVSLSNTGISISSLANFSSDKGCPGPDVPRDFSLHQKRNKRVTCAS